MLNYLQNNLLLLILKTSENDKDRLHTEDIADILKHKGYKVDKIEVGRLLNRIGIGKYNKMCNIVLLLFLLAAL